VREVIEREYNVVLGEKLAEERRHLRPLRPLPPMALPAYTTMTAKVCRGARSGYSVPARLIGQRVRVLLHHDHLEVLLRWKAG
jgi:hypothetical protein